MATPAKPKTEQEAMASRSWKSPALLKTRNWRAAGKSLHTFPLASKRSSRMNRATMRSAYSSLELYSDSSLQQPTPLYTEFVPNFRPSYYTPPGLMGCPHSFGFAERPAAVLPGDRACGCKNHNDHFCLRSELKVLCAAK